AWCRLGLSHAENEHDSKAIAAFNNCLKIQPNNEEARVEERFLTAARQQAGTADADLQNALGILYNLSRNYERAVECMKLAIASRPEDARLWNRLGATLANGDRTPEAVAAYREALQRYPLYVRARYNLGISCLHLQSYREAVEHFVSALELQKGGKESSSIWPTLRSATIRMRGAPMDLLPALDRRDLNAFKAAL
ncbi:tetratricopeptide repeat protein, partial [Cooperia oncophora]